MKSTCSACENNFKVLTEEDLCVYCSRNERGFWPKRFTNATDGEGRPIIGAMKFKSKVKK